MEPGKSRIMRLIMAVLLVPILILCARVALATPQIKFTKVSHYGNANGYTSGKVSGVDFSQYKVAGYIEVDDALWTKPTLAAPLTDISADGTFTFDITTGGCDAFAFRVLAFLVPANIDQEKIKCFPCCINYLVDEAVARASYKRSPKPKIIKFSGKDWTVKRRDCPGGPGGNLFSDDPRRVWVDQAGLHLTITKGKSGRWYSTEVILKKSFGYGIYRIVTNSRVDIYNENVVGGLFLWDTQACAFHNREIDILEFARWGNANEYTNAQNVVQPCNACPGCSDNCERFRVDLTNEDQLLTHFLIWTPKKAEFRTYRGKFASLPAPSDKNLVNSWVYDGSDLPEPGKEKVRFNLWLFGGNPPSDGKKADLVITDFAWTPIEKVTVTIDGVSPYGSLDGYVWGHVIGVDPSQYEVETYIYVRSGWWTKPFWNSPFTPIKSDKTWKCDITTGGVDQEATKVAVFLVPKGTPAQLASGQASLPQQVYADAVSNAQIDRQPK